MKRRENYLELRKKNDRKVEKVHVEERLHNL
jgi:hypothetical protein